MDIIISTLGSTAFSILEPISESAIGAFLGNRFHEWNDIHREQKEPVQQSMKAALEEWLIAILNNLKAQEYQEEELQQFSLRYQEAFDKFLHDPQVIEELLQPFFATTTDYRIDSKLLMRRWAALNLPQLPEEFDIASVNRAYLRRVKKAGIVKPAFQALFRMQLAQEKTHHPQAICGGLPDFDLKQYIKRMYQKYEVLESLALVQNDVDGNSLKLKDVFVPPMVRANCPLHELPKEIWQPLQEQDKIFSDVPGRQAEKLEQRWESWTLIESESILAAVVKPANNRMILLGDPGAGKSSLARYLLLTLLDENAQLVKNNEAFIDCLPLLVELRHYSSWLVSNKGDNFLEYFHYLGKTEEYGLNHLELKPFLNTQKTLVIFDGLDEIFDPIQRENVTQAIIGFTLSYEKARVLVTSRIAGYHGEALRAVDFYEYTLQNFELKQIKTFARNWFNLILSNQQEEIDYRYQRIETALQNSPAIRQLAGNPLLLTMIATIAKHQELPSKRVKLYEYATEVLCHHWNVTRHKKPTTETSVDFMQKDNKLELLRKVAWWMQTNAKGLVGNFILGDDLYHEIADYLRTRWDLAETEIGQISQAMITQFKAPHFILYLYGAQVYGFVHRTFLEYFCATEIIYRFEKQQMLSFEQFKTDIFLTYFRDETWHEILRLTCGMVEPGLVGLLVEMLVSQTEMEGKEGLKGLKFAQTCLNEVDDLKQIESTVQNLYVKWKELVDHKDWPVRYVAVQSLVKYYHERRETYSLLQQVVVKDESEYIRSLAFESLKHYHERRETYLLLQQVVENDEDERVRRAAIESLVEHYHDRRETYSLLQQVVINDEDRDIRRAAIKSLVEHYHGHRETYSLLQQVVINDENEDIRRAAVESLTKHQHEHPETYSLLQQVIQNDRDKGVRFIALQSLAEHYHEHLETYSLLQQVVVNDEHEGIRRTAVKSLAEHYHDRDETYSLLQQVVVNDDSRNVRRVAVYSLAKHHHEHHDTYLLLQQVVMNDEHEDVRRAAVESLAKHHHEHRETYSLLQQVVANDKDENVRCASVKVIAENYYDETWQRLLSKHFHRSRHWMDWADSKVLIDEKRVEKAAEALKLPIETIRQHYEEIAKEIPLRLTWQLKADLKK